MSYRFMSFTTVALLAALLTTVVRAADDTLPPEPFPLEPPDTSSPFDTFRTFTTGCETIYNLLEAERGTWDTEGVRRVKDEAERVFGCLDLSEEPAFARQYRAGEATVCIREILDRLPPVEASSIPGGPGWGDQELPARWKIPHTSMTIVRLAEGPRAGEYLFSAETVSNAAEDFDRVRYLPYRPGALEGFRQWFVSMPRSEWLARLIEVAPSWVLTRVGGQSVWQWIGLVLVLGTAVTIVVLVYRIGGSRAADFRRKNLLRFWITLWAPALVLFVPVVVNRIIRNELVISGTTLLVIHFVLDAFILVALVVLVIGINTRIIETLVSSPRIQPRGLDEQLIRLVGRILGITAAVIVFLEGGKYLGIPLTTLLAGAGVGGVALALAAQDMLKNLFGSLMILFDKPFRLGERIVAQGYDGVVEEIGLRSTRIRTLTGNQVTIPNEQLARIDIENIGRRRHIRRATSLRLPIDTPREKAEEAVAIVREILADHEGLSPDFPPRVFLDEFNADSLNVRIFYWYHPPNYWDFLAHAQQVNLAIKDRFTAAGLQFALPTSTMHIDGGGDLRRIEDRPSDDTASQAASDSASS